MKLQKDQLEKMLKKLMIRYAHGFEIKREKIHDYVESYYEPLCFFENSDVEKVLMQWNGNFFPSLKEVKDQCWELIRERENSLLIPKSGKWTCKNESESSMHWAISEIEAQISRRQYKGDVFCRLCEYKMMAEKYPGGREDLWLVSMGLK